ncbi:MAG: hypothetical protein AAF202_09440, partial [Pseudomonadota bacterium]
MSPLLLVFVASLGLLWAEIGLADQFFSTREFVNLFVEEGESLEVAEARLNRVIHSYYLRAEVPVPTASGRYGKVRFFEHLQDAVDDIDEKAEIMPADVRATLAHIYSRMYREYLRDPRFDISDEMDEIISEEHGIPIYELKGVGSDLDLVVRNHEAKNFAAIKQAVVEASSDLSGNMTAMVGTQDLTRVMFAMADVQEWRHHTDLSVNQGGADIDWLAFSMRDRQLILPDTQQNIIRAVLQGNYSYLAPAEGYAARDVDKQTLRGLRPLIELPFLRLEDEEVLRGEVGTL